MMRAPLLLVAFSLPILATAAPSDSKPEEKSAEAVIVERVAAIVNDTIILESELVLRARPMMGEIEQLEDTRERQRQVKSLIRQVLQDMIDEQLVLEAANEAKLEVTDTEVSKAMEEVKRQNKLTDEQLVEALATQGLTFEQYRKDIRKQILRMRAVNAMVRPRVTVTDDEVREQYDRMLGKTAGVTEVHARHILLKLPDRPREEEMKTARRKAGELVERARSGEDFAKLVRENSEDPGTKDQGGELGWFKRGELPTEWEEILFSMSDGEVRGPIRGPQGLHVFLVAETKKESHRPFEDVKEQLRNQIFTKDMEKQTKVWLEELHKHAHIEVKL